MYPHLHWTVTPQLSPSFLTVRNCSSSLCPDRRILKTILLITAEKHFLTFCSIGNFRVGANAGSWSCGVLTWIFFLLQYSILKGIYGRPLGNVFFLSDKNWQEIGGMPWLLSDLQIFLRNFVFLWFKLSLLQINNPAGLFFIQESSFVMPEKCKYLHFVFSTF